MRLDTFLASSKAQDIYIVHQRRLRKISNIWGLIFLQFLEPRVLYVEEEKLRKNVFIVRFFLCVADEA